MISETNLSASGTSFHGHTINTSVGRLKELFPNSYYASNDGQDKSNYDWTLEIDGEVFTIYDWKEYRPISDYELIEFHIGAKGGMTSAKAQEELKKIL